MIREVAAEFLGTFVLIVFGCAAVAQVVLSGHANGEYLSINLGWAFGVTMGIYVAGGVTGAHLNPAVTVALAALRGFPWRKVVPYCLAQLAGAFVASVVVYVLYFDALREFDGGTRQVLGPQATAGIWATYPQPFLSPLPGGLIDQIIGTALLVLCIFALTDTRNLAPAANVAPNDRCCGARDRYDLRLQLRLCDQSGP
jgi:MIP family channel proteins